MSTWHTDFETRSRADLGEIGAFKYSQDASTEVMCLAIKRDDGPTLVWIPPEFEVVDSLAGDTVSDPGALDLLKAMLADDGPVYAHNAQFEYTQFRYVMPRYGFTEPTLTRWRCTQAMARRANIPSSLGKAAAALNLANQKDPAGERLIKTFSIPQKDTGEFIQPRQFPDKWHAFVEYCRQDVETEHELAHVLKPFDLSGWLLDTFHTDLIINDRGMPVNMIALRNADTMIDDTSVPAFAEFNQLTGLNPTQNAKLRVWFADNGLPLDNLQSDTLAALDVSTLPEAPGRAIALLRKIGFAAVKKIKTMIACAGDDGFIRGSLQFYGAAATGRWCLTGDHEVLTADGWVRFDKWRGGEIAVWKNDVVSFQKSEVVSFPYEGDVIHHRSHRIAQVATPDHKMGVWSARTNKFEDRTVDRVNGSVGIPYTGVLSRPTMYSNDELRVIVATQADGCYTRDGLIRYRFKKERKIERMKKLLRRASIHFVESESESEGVTTLVVPSKCVPLYLRMFQHKTFGSWLLYVDAAVFFEELEQWDAYRCGPKSIQYSTCNKENSDWVQALAHTSGLTANIVIREGRKENWNTSYVVNIWLEPKGYHRFTKNQVREKFSGTVYCAVTSTGYFLTRREGIVWVTGNSGRLHQPQNFKRPEFGGTEEMYEHVCNGASKEFLELWYGKDIFSILASSIRHFIHDPQGPMLSADYSAIEARVAAWLAGEEWQLEVFRTHGKIYEMNAERMFGVPMAQVGKSLRQKSKVSSLACQYGGAVNAMIAMGALEMGLKEEELQPLVDAWRAANPNIVKHWYASSNAAINAVNNPGEKFWAGKVAYFAANVAKAKYLFCVLPSGRRLAYRDPIVKNERRVSKKTGSEYTQQVLSCYGQLPGAGGAKSQKWGQVYLSPGLLFENQDQAMAFDLMANGVLKAEAKGYRSYSLIHDEVLAAFDGPHQSLAEFQACLEDAPPWAAGLPLGTSGEIVKYYTK